jgi:hypothetical protein
MNSRPRALAAQSISRGLQLMARVTPTLALAIAGMLMVCSQAWAASGVVVHKPSSCDYFLVETTRGIALLEWYGGNDPDEGDRIVGDFESYGMKRVYNTTADAELRVYVEDYLLSEDDAIEKLYEECD